MRFLVDESAGEEVTKHLRELGHNTSSVAESLLGADDEEVVRKAVRENRIIVTNDKDFGLLAISHKVPGLILLRLADESVENKKRVLRETISKYRSKLYGNILTITEGKIRVRAL